MLSLVLQEKVGNPGPRQHLRASGEQAGPHWFLHYDILKLVMAD